MSSLFDFERLHVVHVVDHTERGKIVNNIQM